jgi:hypothetical protein
MLFRSRTKTAIAAAAGLGGLGAAAATGAQTPEPAPAPLPDAQPPAPRDALVVEHGGRAVAAAVRSAKKRAKRRSGFTIVRVRAGERVSLRAKPGGRAIRRVASRTEFGSPQTLAVVGRRGRWLAVTSSALPNGRLAWVNGRSSKLQERRTRVSLQVDLSEGTLELREGGLRLERVRVALGAKVSPTPTGRFAITDKLSGTPYGGVYGCCILALSGKQDRLPPGWKGGNRLAIHGSPGRSGRFAGSSAGCVRADRRTLRVLMREVPLGTPVFVRS